MGPVVIISLCTPLDVLSNVGGRIVSGGFAIGGVNGHRAAHGSSMVGVQESESDGREREFIWLLIRNYLGGLILILRLHWDVVWLRYGRYLGARVGRLCMERLVNLEKIRMIHIMREMRMW
jgi:hypothetical protein